MLDAYLSSIAVRHNEHRSWKSIWYQSFQSESFLLNIIIIHHSPFKAWIIFYQSF